MDIRYCILAEISIHVPAWGTTQLFHLLLNMHIYFNPRSRVGNDASDSLAYRINSISIHVPAWGTTLLYCAPAPTFYENGSSSSIPSGMFIKPFASVSGCAGACWFPCCPAAALLSANSHSSTTTSVVYTLPPSLLV